MGKYLSAFLGMMVSFQPVPLPSVVDNAPDNAANERLIVEARKVDSKIYADPIVKETLTMWVTAYSSTPEETDDTPFITASNTRVRHGIVATNMLPFGTRIQFPEVFGEETFTVEDRMHVRKVNFVDIWMHTKEEARKFGIVKTKILVLGEKIKSK